MKGSEVIKSTGVKSLQEASDISTYSTRALMKYAKEEPKKFSCIVAGVAAIKAEMALKEYNADVK